VKYETIVGAKITHANDPSGVYDVIYATAQHGARASTKAHFAS